MGDADERKNEAANKLESEMKERDETRTLDDRAEREDLNQGMDTGTHSSTHSGVNWGSSYRVLPEAQRVPPTKEQMETRAYELYLQRGDNGGSPEQDWLRAVEEIGGRQRTA